MDPLILAPWRDLALILLIIEAAVIVAVPGIVFFFVLKGMRALKRIIRKPLSQGRMWAKRIQMGTVRTTNAIAGVPIGISSNVVRARVTARGVWDYILGR